jgi:hypothetical protein
MGLPIGLMMLTGFLISMGLSNGLPILMDLTTLMGLTMG